MQRVCLAEWSKASGLGPDLFVGVGSNPTADNSLIFFIFQPYSRGKVACFKELIEAYQWFNAK